MSQVKIPSVFSNITGLADFQRFVSAWAQDITAKFNGQIDFVENIRARGPFGATFTGTGSTQVITHNLGIVPTGYLVISKTSSCEVYATDAMRRTWSGTTMSVAGTAAGGVMLYII